jgi:hypothetical protein
MKAALIIAAMLAVDFVAVLWTQNGPGAARDAWRKIQRMVANVDAGFRDGGPR